jgi:Mg-chelatase subunit ChlD
VDRAALIRALAEGGVDAAKALIAEQARHDASLATRIAELRERLRRQASRKVQRIVGEYDRRVGELETVRKQTEAELAVELANAEERRRRAKGLDWSKIDAGLVDDVSSALLLPDAPWMQPERPTFLERLTALFAAIVAFFRRLFGRKAPPAKKGRGERSMVFARLGEGGRSIGASELGEAIARLTPREREELSERVDKSLSARERDLRREAEAKRKDADQQRRSLEAERDEARRRAEEEAKNRVRDAETRRVERELKERGFVAEKDGTLAVTYGLVERFARLVLEEETRELPADVRLSLSGGASTGMYEKARLRQSEEIAHLDLPSSILAARQAGSRHIDESTSFVYREVTSERVHVVLAFDRSGSMAEGEKLPAAKKALLALYVAVRKRHPDATIDVVAFDNRVDLLDLVELWECQPGAFTNTAEALRTAFLLLRASRASRREVYLVTDGLPEAYTDSEGSVRSGNLPAAMEAALARARELATVRPLKFSLVLIRSEHPEYEAAAREIARTLEGTLVVTDPNRLGVELLVRWIGRTETVRQPVAAPLPAGKPSPPPAGTPGKPRAKRRKVDRRMGG